ncbi:MAG: hypothetical protein J2P55_15615 [Rhizobiales bacterium]|nr:hypothetical protein [Hyphomicrobiales bacterium]
MSEFAEWLKRNPPPDLAALVAQFGGQFCAITAEAWAAYDEAVAEWRRRYQARSPSVARSP